MIRYLLILVVLLSWVRGEQAPPPGPPVVVASEPEPTPGEAAVDAGEMEFSVQEAPASDPLVVSVWKEAADDTDHVTVVAPVGYEIVKSGVQIEGDGAFHLTHPDFQNQSVLLDPIFAVEADSNLFFESRLGWATTSQSARAQLSTDGGSNWITLWSRSGTGDAGQGAYERVEISLEAYTGQEVRIRFQYFFSGGSAFTQTDTNVGWLLDDIQVGPEYLIDPVAYSIGDPTGLEQQTLEFINRARADAMMEAFRLKETDDPDVINAINYFEVELDLMVEQFGELTRRTQPLAFNERLIAAARLHSQDMLDNNFQGHESSSNPPSPNQPGDGVGDRVGRQGYVFSTVAENVFSFGKSAWHAHAGFNIDWGDSGSGSVGGMQDPPGHRLSIHHPGYREIGVGLLEGSNTDVGPMIVTHNFGTQAGGGQPYITGVAWEDLNANGEYDPGEGLAGIEVVVEGERFMGVTTASGGYAIPVSGNGDHVVHFSSEDSGQPDWSTTVRVEGSANRKVDYTLHDLTAKVQILELEADPSAPGAFRILVQGNQPPSVWTSGDLIHWVEETGHISTEVSPTWYQVQLPVPPPGATFHKIKE